MLMRMSEHPNESEIFLRPEENDGCLYCKVPSTWLKIAPPVKREMSEKQRAAMEKNLQKAQAQRRLSEKS